MVYIEARSIAVVAAALILGAWAGEPDFIHQMERDFKMGLFARQDQQGEPIGLSNLNTFRGDLGASAPPITLSNDPKHPYRINDEEVSTFGTAVDKTCDFQKNECAELANGESRGEFSVSECDQQQLECKSFLLASATQTAFQSRVTLPGNDEFDFICEN